MSFACGCDDWGDDAEWYWNGEKTAPLATKNSRHCRSCKEKLAPGTDVRIYARFRSPHSEIEQKIHGDEVPLAPWYLCLPCADLMDALSAVNVCVDWTRPLADEVAEFNENYAPSGFRLKTKAALEEIKEDLFLEEACTK